MFKRFVIPVMVLISNVMTSESSAQTTVLSKSPPNVEYQYQMYYPRWWGWPGPGLSIGGSLPSQGREGISSFYGRPLPPPLGAGVYVNSFSYATQLPGPPNSFGLAAASGSTNAAAPPPTSQVSGMGGPSLSTAGALSGLPAAPPLSQVNPDPSRRPVRLSNELAMEKARQVILFGDEKLKNQQWLQAYVNYRNAVLISDDLADAHLRLSIASLALNRFPEAAVEFKRALFIDPTAARPDETLTTILGPDSRTVRAEVTRSVAMWAREDLRDQDRLFLLGAVLHLDGDKRAPEILEAAYRLTGSGDHLLALMSSPTQSPSVSVPPPVPNPPEMQTLPELHQRPLALH